MHRRIPDISKISDAISWTPTRNLDEIIADVIEDARATDSAAAEAG
jgi:hypothetical protein